MKTKITEMLGIQHPIIQGGMGIGVSQVGLASAVAQAGGIGVIATAGIGCNEEDFKSNFVEANARALRNQIRGVKEKVEAGKGSAKVTYKLKKNDNYMVLN